MNEKELKARNIEGGIWPSASVNDAPLFTLTKWRIISIPAIESKERTFHFVGFNQRGLEGRVSSAIVAFDPTTMKGITYSGRVYELSGESGWHEDSEYVLEQWARIQGIKWDDVHDATLDELIRK